MKQTDFELVKDAEDLPSFLSRLRLANHLAWDVVFLTIISYDKTYEQITRLGAFASLKYSIDKQRNYSLMSYDMYELGELFDSTYGKVHEAIGYLFIAGNFITNSRDLLSHLESMIDTDDEYILPHLKLALAYCPLTNGELT